MKNKKIGFECDVWYVASGYADGMKATACHVFYVIADSFGEACEKLYKRFEEYQKINTAEGSKYHGLHYQIKDVRLEKRIFD